MKKPNDIAIVVKFEKLVPSTYDTKEISVEIGVLKEETGKPQNFNLNYETPKASNGGLRARIFASEYGTGSNANLFSDYGPVISYGHLNDYKHAIRALERVGKRQQEQYVARGNAADAAEAMGRWLEACGITSVFLRPDADARRSWHNEGEWMLLSVGEFVNRVRGNLHVAPVVETEVASV